MDSSRKLKHSHCNTKTMDFEQHDKRLIRLQKNVVEFGKTLIAWRRQNNWTQYTIDKWASYAGFKFPPPGHLSTIENGKNMHLRPITIIQIAEVNSRIANLVKQDLLEIQDSELRKVISRSRPIATDDFVRWKEEHFFLHLIGILERPFELGNFVNAPLRRPIANSKEEAFMMLSPKRFILDREFILVPKEMTTKEKKIIELLCSEHGYKVAAEKNGAE